MPRTELITESTPTTETSFDANLIARSPAAVDAERAARGLLAPEAWEARLRDRTAETVRRGAARAAEREAKARRRAHGLVDRNAARLAEARRRAKAATRDPALSREMPALSREMPALSREM